VKLALDHHYSARIATSLRDLGHDVITVSERGWEAETDEDVLALCLGEQRALLTNNVADFAVIVRRWELEGRPHAGLVFSSDKSMPRSSDSIGQYVRALDYLLRSLPGDDAFTDQVWWLQPTGST
jgi:predicted nuclease of predicted toxin-antitoxin system